MCLGLTRGAESPDYDPPILLSPLHHHFTNLSQSRLTSSRVLTFSPDSFPYLLHDIRLFSFHL